MEFYDMKIHTVKYSRCTEGNNGGADAASGIVLDIGAILKPRVEINWEKELKR